MHASAERLCPWKRSTLCYSPRKPSCALPPFTSPKIVLKPVPDQQQLLQLIQACKLMYVLIFLCAPTHGLV